MKRQGVQTKSSNGSAVATAFLVAVAAATLLVPVQAEAGQLSKLEVDGKVLKTKPANGAAIAPLLDALVAYDLAAGKNGGKAPEDAADRLKKIRALAGPAKAEVRAFVGRLKAEGELAEFSALVEAKARETGSGKLMSEVGGGKATQLLLGAEAAIDRDINARAANSTTAALLMHGILDLVSVREAHAGLRSGVCSGFWFVITLGYGERFAYESCYQ